MRIAYFVHDLTDPAVTRRVRMFRLGGATVLLSGFRRGPLPDDIDGLAPYDLGQTADGRFLGRLAKTVSHAVKRHRLVSRIAGADVIVARNLEMLAIAQSVRGGRTDVPIVYECLDIHRLLLSNRLPGVALRAVEGYLTRRSSALMTSSPSFVDNYFVPRSNVDLPTILVENKVLVAEPQAVVSTPRPPAPTGAWRIGWFGAIRCLKSFQILSAVTRRLEGRLTVVIRGRPAYTEFPDFDAMVADEPYMQFAGPYKNPDDLAAIYDDVDFAWVIDFFEEGLNSEWLLPNRLYESGWTGTVPIAREGTATAQWLARRNAGVRIGGDIAIRLLQFFAELGRSEMQILIDSVARVDRSIWICTSDDCRQLIERLRPCINSSNNVSS